MVKKLQVHFKCFKLILVHLDAGERQGLIPNGRVGLILLASLLDLTSTPHFDEGIGGSFRIQALDISCFDDGDPDQVLFSFQ